MKFRAPEEIGEIRVADTAGHTFVLGREWTDVPERWRRAVVADGAEIEGMATNTPKPGVNYVDQDKLVLDAVTAMAKEGNPDEFGNDGKPKLDAVSKRAGFNVVRAARDKAWEKLSQ